MMMKKVVVIGAVSQNGVYGEGDKIPWHLKEDFVLFKRVTMGHTVIMGRKTWESLPEKFRPLPGRVNMVITNTPGYKADGATIFASLEQAIAAATTEHIFCIGGADIWYAAMTRLADEAWITLVKRDYPVTEGVTRLAFDLVDPSASFGFYCLERGLFPKAGVVVTEDTVHFEIAHWQRL